MHQIQINGFVLLWNERNKTYGTQNLLNSGIETDASQSNATISGQTDLDFDWDVTGWGVQGIINQSVVECGSGNDWAATDESSLASVLQCWGQFKTDIQTSNASGDVSSGSGASDWANDSAGHGVQGRSGNQDALISRAVVHGQGSRGWCAVGAFEKIQTNHSKLWYVAKETLVKWKLTGTEVDGSHGHGWHQSGNEEELEHLG